MTKKFKLVGGGVAVGALLLFLLFGSDALSYVSTSISKVHNSVKGSVPVDFELERARNEVDKITPEIQSNMQLIAKEEVELEQLSERIDSLEESLVGDHRAIMRLQADLESGSETFIYTGNEYSATEVKRDLSNRFSEYKVNDETLKSLKQVYVSRQHNLDIAEEKLAEMQSIKRQLVAQIDNLEARNKMVEVARSSSELVISDSQVARTSELIDEIKSRLSAEEKILDAEILPMDRIPVEADGDENDIVADVAAYFNQKSTESLATSSR